MGKARIHLSRDGEKTILMAGCRELLISSDSLLFPTAWLAYCLFTGYEHYRRQDYPWWAVLVLGFLSCLSLCRLLLSLVVRNVHKRRMKATG